MMYSSVFVVVLLASLCYTNGEVQMEVHLDESPVTAKLGDNLTLTCTMPGYGIHVQPMFARWLRRHANSAAYVTISKDTVVTPGYHRISVQMFPGGYTTWYTLTIKGFQSEDTGMYKCVTAGPTEDVVVASGTVQVIV